MASRVLTVRLPEPHYARLLALAGEGGVRRWLEDVIDRAGGHVPKAPLDDARSERGQIHALVQQRQREQQTLDQLRAARRQVEEQLADLHRQAQVLAQAIAEARVLLAAVERLRPGMELGMLIHAVLKVPELRGRLGPGVVCLLAGAAALVGRACRDRERLLVDGGSPP